MILVTPVLRRHTSLAFKSCITYCKYRPYIHQHPRYLHSSKPKPLSYTPAIKMLSTGHSMEGSTLEEMLIPAFRTVNFKHSRAICLVSSFLRMAWVTKPPTSIDFDEWLGSFRGTHLVKQDDPRAPKNPDLSTLHTPWRDEVYYKWNHVFYDIFKFLQEAAVRIGKFQPPSHDIIPLYSLGQDQQQAAPLEKVWETNVLLCWAYLAPGVKVRMFKGERDESGQRKEYGVFDEENSKEVWFLFKGTKVVFEIEGVTDAAQEGPAAVLAVGVGSNDDLPASSKEIKAEEEEEEEGNPEKNSRA